MIAIYTKRLIQLPISIQQKNFFTGRGNWMMKIKYRYVELRTGNTFVIVAAIIVMISN